MPDFVSFCLQWLKVPEAPNKRRPYFNFFSSTCWRPSNWPRSDLHTLWHDRTPLVRTGKLLWKQAGPDQHLWKLEPDYESELGKYVGELRIPLADFAIWLNRGRALDASTTIQDLAVDVVAKFKLTDRELTELFDVLPSAVADEPEAFAADWQGEALLAMLPPQPEEGSVGTEEAGEEDEGNATPATLPDDPTLVTNVATYLKDIAHLDFTEEFVQNVIYALRVDRFVVLAGKPGTAKTSFATALGDALNKALPGATATTLLVSVNEDTSEHDLLGYRDLSGEFIAGEVVRIPAKRQDGPGRLLRGSR